jgi:hypothetical protein
LAVPRVGVTASLMASMAAVSAQSSRRTGCRGSSLVVGRIRSTRTSSRRSGRRYAVSERLCDTDSCPEVEPREVKRFAMARVDRSRIHLPEALDALPGRGEVRHRASSHGREPPAKSMVVSGCTWRFSHHAGSVSAQFVHGQRDRVRAVRVRRMARRGGQALRMRGRYLRASR